jgi:hypothetical protein
MATATYDSSKYCAKKKFCDAKEQIERLTNHLNEAYTLAKATPIKNKIINNPAAICGCIRVPVVMTDNETISVLQYGWVSDNHFESLKSWVQADLIWFDKANKQVMCWGEKNVVVDAMDTIEAMFRKKVVTAFQQCDYEHRRLLKEERRRAKEDVYGDDDPEYRASKHS